MAAPSSETTLAAHSAGIAGDWLSRFESAKGRKLRVLHIGNIANNAYNNAKIQRDRGIEADVLSFDYYHIMACPEWEDAAFKGEVADQFYPDWWAVDLRGFRRPDWFAQGPFDASVRYLLAKTAGAASAKALWRWLNFERWLLCRRSLPRLVALAALAALTGRKVGQYGAPANAILWNWAGRNLTRLTRINLFSRRIRRRMRAAGMRLLRHARTADVLSDTKRHLDRTVQQRLRLQARMQEQLGAAFVSEFGADLEHFFRVWYHPYLRLLLRRYDIVQCYATYTAMPFLLEQKYLAYEHGTIRVIPFQRTPEGRMCMASYRCAEKVFVTNSDNLPAARAMGVDAHKVVALPHAFDSGKLVRFAAATRISPSRDRVVFFTPTRQHWVDQDPGWAKGNDRVFAALKNMKERGYRCELRAVAWGNDLEASKERVRALGLEDMVVWLPTLKKRELWAAYIEAHAVIDQFVVPAMGGVTFEAMMLARRVIAAIDPIQAAEFFGEPPPIYNSRTVDEITAAMVRVMEDPDDAGGAGTRNQDWMQQYHSADRIVDLQLAAYRSVLQALDAEVCSEGMLESA